MHSARAARRPKGGQPPAKTQAWSWRHSHECSGNVKALLGALRRMERRATGLFRGDECSAAIRRIHRVEIEAEKIAGVGKADPPDHAADERRVVRQLAAFHLGSEH